MSSIFDSPTNPSPQFAPWKRTPRIKHVPPDKPAEDPDNFEANENVSPKNFDTILKNMEASSSKSSSSKQKNTKDFFKKIGTFFNKKSGEKLMNNSGVNDEIGGIDNGGLEEEDCEVIENFNVSQPLPDPPVLTINTIMNTINSINAINTISSESDTKSVGRIYDKINNNQLPLPTINQTQQQEDEVVELRRKDENSSWPNAINGVNPIYDEPDEDQSEYHGTLRNQRIIPATTKTAKNNYSTTEKSGSSGYYGSNQYSTSSVDEHIYCEPIIEYVTQTTDPSESLTAIIVESPSNDNNLNELTVNNADLNNESHSIDEKQCLESLRKSITNLENCLDNHLGSANQMTPNSKARSSNLPLKSKLPPISASKPGTSSQSTNSSSSMNQLQTMIDSMDTSIPRPIWPIYDDSLLDINLESFESKHGATEVGNLINLESPILGAQKSIPSQSTPHYAEDVINFHNTREVLENIQGRLANFLESSQVAASAPSNVLEENIHMLKLDLENYLRAMHDKNEIELKKFCAGMKNNQNIVTIKNAFERKENTYQVLDETIPGYERMHPISRSSNSQSSSMSSSSGQLAKSYYQENLEQDQHFGTVYVKDGFTMKCNERINPFTTRPGTYKSTHLTDYARNPQLNRSLTHYYVNCDKSNCSGSSGNYSSCSNCNSFSDRTKDLRRSYKEHFLQNNLQLSSVILMDSFGKKSLLQVSDREKMLLEWHKNKPSIWEMYYGSNRLLNDPEHTLYKPSKFKKAVRNTASYPSARPECDFTLDVPRVEALRSQLKKEKNFRCRCRIFCVAFSFIFFMITVIFCSMLSTKGKKMFGSML